MGNQCSPKNYREGSSSVLQIPKGFPLHQGSILGVTCDDDGNIISCSDDKAVGITGPDYFTLGPSIDRRTSLLVGHTRAVNRAAVHGQRLFTVSRDLSLRQVTLIHVSLLILYFWLDLFVVIRACVNSGT